MSLDDSSSSAALNAIGDRAGDKILRALSASAMPPRRRSTREAGAADYLGVEPSYLRNLRWKKSGPRFRKIGAMPIYDYAELDLWVEQHALQVGGSDA